jgi:hypothetical protein
MYKMTDLEKALIYNYKLSKFGKHVLGIVQDAESYFPLLEDVQAWHCALPNIAASMAEELQQFVSNVIFRLSVV